MNAYLMVTMMYYTSQVSSLAFHAVRKRREPSGCLQLQNKQSTSEILNMATTLHCCHTGLVLWVRDYIHTDKHTYMLDLGQTIFTIILNLTLFILTYSCQ